MYLLTHPANLHRTKVSPVIQAGDFYTNRSIHLGRRTTPAILFNKAFIYNYNWMPKYHQIVHQNQQQEESINRNEQETNIEEIRDDSGN
jgi:hypothetical protein